MNLHTNINQRARTVTHEFMLFSSPEPKVSYINPANHVPGVQIGNAPGVISFHRLIVGKT